jgi:threonyl-tRNA synthetase
MCNKEFINIKLFNNIIKKYPYGVTPLSIATSINPNLIKNILCATIDNSYQIDINDKIKKNVALQFNTWKDIEAKKIFWHSSSHILIKSIIKIFPNAIIANSFVTEKGFFCDIDLMNDNLSNKLNALKKQLHKYCNQKKNIYSKKISVLEAKNIYYKYNPYIDFFFNNKEFVKLNTWKGSKFYDVCDEVHIPDINIIKIIKIINISGVYWQGDNKNKQITRIHCLSFPNNEEYEKYITIHKNMINNDHRKLGKKLKLFFLSDSIGLGLPIWLSRGSILKNTLKEFILNIDNNNGYNTVETPHIGSKQLYETSGHWDKYKIHSFAPIKTPDNKNEYLLKPMNCPHHCEIYKYSVKSYKDLPLKINEFGTVYRYEKSGELQGLTRVRGFTQDDGHIFCTSEQVFTEINSIIKSIIYIYQRLGFEKYEVQISLKEKLSINMDKYIGSHQEWKKAEKYIFQAIKNYNILTNIAYGEAAFYGPKLDFLIKDNFNRKWQLGTIQIDYNLPKRFNLKYIDDKNNKLTPILIHRAYFGSLERVIAILLENKFGVLPFWLTPYQVIIINLNEECINYSKNILNLLISSKIRTKLNIITSNLNKEIKKADIEKIPFIITIGNKEKNLNLLSVREYETKKIRLLNFKDFKKIIDDKNIV